ncbi:MAG: hypothetical protein ABSF44_10850 [Candidatus Bathyarchaeia archaeon]
MILPTYVTSPDYNLTKDEVTTLIRIMQANPLKAVFINQILRFALLATLATAPTTTNTIRKTKKAPRENKRNPNKNRQAQVF